MMTLALESPEQLFKDFLVSHGHPIDGPVNLDSSKFHYLKCPHGSKTDARYKFYSDGIPSAYFKCWYCDVEADFCSKKKSDVSTQEWQAHKERLAECKRLDEHEAKQRHLDVAALAQDVFSKASEEQANTNDYLSLKCVKNYGLREVIHEDDNTRLAKCYPGTLLAPCYDIDDNLVNLERIYFDNQKGKHQKRPLSGGLRSGAFYILGEVTDQLGVISIAEGYCSAAIAHEATGYPTAISFNCGNIGNVAKQLRLKYPQASLLIVSDDDKWHDDPKLRHSGQKAAKKACANVTNITYILPDFSVLGLSDEKLKGLSPTDVNDLFVQLIEKGLNRTAALDIVNQQLTFRPTLHAEILDQLIKKITRVDFRELVDIPEGEKLKNQHFLIITIEQILELAKANNWGICKNHDFIYLFNGEYWHLLDADELKIFLGRGAEKMGVDKFSARYFNFKENLYKQFMAEAHLPQPEQAENVVHINLKNGTFEISPDGTRLKAFSRMDFMTYQLPFEYNPESKAALFDDYLNKVLPEKGLQDILSEYLGYVFIRPSRLKLEKVLLLFGSGANGKSVFYEIVRALLGEQNTSEFSLQSLTDEAGYYRASIANKLVNYASEINGKIGSSFFKQIASGEPIEARFPHGRPFVIKQYAKLIFNCNELPKDVEQTEAYFRRFLIIPFEVTIPEAEQDKQLAQKIISNELSGVFNWVLLGLNRLLEQKQFTQCETVKLARQRYERDSDSVQLFLEDKGYKKSADDWIALNSIYPEYRTYCLDDGYKPVNKSNFRKRLENTKVTFDRKNVGVVVFLIKNIPVYKGHQEESI
jgi:putative DNA primase/helicase